MNREQELKSVRNELTATYLALQEVTKELEISNTLVKHYEAVTKSGYSELLDVLYIPTKKEEIV